MPDKGHIAKVSNSPEGGLVYLAIFPVWPEEVLPMSKEERKIHHD
jgi:hypothetical protein